MAFAPAPEPDRPALGRDYPNIATTPLAVFAPFSTVLDDIHRESVALAAWHRPPPLRIRSGDLLHYSGVRFEAAASDVSMRLASELSRHPYRFWHDPVTKDAADLATLFATIIGCSQVELRLEPVSTDACRKFHADCVTCRLITTYTGQATQWLPSADMTGSVRQLSAGDVALFKGGLWMPERPILHRSPPIAGTGEIRLLLVINPRA